MATRPGPAGAIWPPRQRQQQQAAATPGPGPGGRARAARGAGGRGRAPPRPRHTGGRSGQGAEWCRGGGGRVRLRQAAAALGQTKTEKALGWAGLGWAGRHQRPGRAAAGRLCGDSLVLAAGGCGGSAEKQQSVSPTSNSQNRSPDMLSGTCYLPCHHRSAPLQTYGAQNLSVLKSKVYMLERKNICCSILPGLLYFAVYTMK